MKKRATKYPTVCMYCAKELQNKSHAYKHKKHCRRTERGIITKEDIQDEKRFLELVIEYNKLTNDSDKKLFRAYVLPLFRLNCRPVGCNFKDSDEKTT